MTKLEQIHEVKYRYPVIKKILQELYRNAYGSGFNSDSNNDVGDWSTAYKEIEPFISQIKAKQRKEIKEDLNSVVAMLMGTIKRKQIINYIKKYRKKM